MAPCLTPRRCARPLVGGAPLAFVLLWSTGFIVAKYAAPHAPPLTFLLYASPVPSLILLPLVVIDQAAVAT